MVSAASDSMSPLRIEPGAPSSVAALHSTPEVLRFFGRAFPKNWNFFSTGSAQKLLEVTRSHSWSVVLVEAELTSSEGRVIESVLKDRPKTDSVIAVCKGRSIPPTVLNPGIARCDLLKIPCTELEARQRVEKHLELNQLRKCVRAQEERIRRNSLLIQERDRVSGMLIHEIRNALTALKGACGILTDPSRDQLHDLARSAVNKKVSSMLELLNDMLQTSRMESNPLSIHKRWIELTLFLEAIDYQGQVIANGNQQHFVSHRPDVDICFYADPSRLEQALLNLILNASKYTPSGGEITLETQLNEEHAEISFSVKDTGMGLSDEIGSTLFEAYTQGDMVDKRSGIGIGLWVVRRIAELHGGFASCFSEGIGKGSEFVLSIPIAEYDQTLASGADPG